jgi:pyruvate dehydrogenase E2 component (dihydrolipoamide acetyltransferase)
MATDVILPKVDMDMTTGRISQWHVTDGDAVKKGQLLFEIETDKAAMEIESPGDGVVRELAATGIDIPVGEVVAVILASGESVDGLRARKTVQPAVSTPARTTIAPATIQPAHGTGVRATPLARRLAKQSGVDLNAVSGSGPHGRIVAGDIESAIAKPTLVETGNTLIPLDGMRRTIAQRLTLSKQTVPHFYLSVTCIIDEMLAIRGRLNAMAPQSADGKALWKLSLNDFIVKAWALALQQNPAANVTWREDGIMQHQSIDIGIAVSVEGGLFTPVVHAAHAKTLSQISRETKDLAVRARARKLLPSEYQGGTSAISNLGMYGIDEFTAIINPPHATILAVGAGIASFVPVDAKPVLKTTMKCTLSCDHRLVDGALGAELLSTFRTFVEEPALMLA